MDRSNLGVDIDQAWIMDGEGDLVLARYEDNVTQAVFNRLTCTMGALDWVYNNYGSYVKTFIGKPNTASRRDQLKRECQTRLNKDPRLIDAEVEIIAVQPRAIGMKVTGTLTGTHENFEEYLLFGEDDLYENIRNYRHAGFHDTYIRTRVRGYTAQPGGRVVIHAHVMDKKTEDFVPIGKVNVRIGTWGIGQAVEVQQSWGREPGSVTIAFNVPLFFSYGLHYMTVKYDGAPGYNSCTKKVPLHIVPFMPTKTFHKHKWGNSGTPNNDVLYMDVYKLGEYGPEKYWHKDAKTLAKDGLPSVKGAVYVEDANGIPVGYSSDGHGKVYLTMIHKLSDKIKTTIRMKESDASFTKKQPYLIEDCIVKDVYGRPVISGKVNILLDVGSRVIKASSNPQTLSFTTNSLNEGTVYQLQDHNGNIVDNVIVSESNDDGMTLQSTDQEGTEIIQID